MHLRIASPPVRHPCYMGINIPSKAELIANGRDVAQITALVRRLQDLFYLFIYLFILYSVTYKNNEMGRYFGYYE